MIKVASRNGRAVYLLNSPFQALSAFEHLRFRGNQHRYKIIHVQSGTRNSVVQTSATLDRLSLRRENIKSSGRSRLIRFYSMLKKTREIVESLEEKDELVVGNPSYDVFADAISRSRAGKTVALDDGLKTVLVWRNFNSSAEDEIRFLQNLKESMFGLSRPDFRLLEYFSLFQGQEPEWAFAKKNEFLSLQGLTTPDGQEQIIILGQPIVEKVSSSNRKVALQFEKNLEKMVSQFPKADLKYYAHRNEDFSKIPRGIKKAGEVVCPDLPVELFLLKEKIRPIAVVGFYSTALFSVPQIFRSSAPSVMVFLPNELGPQVEGLDLWRKAASNFFNDHPSPFHLIE